MHYIIYINTFSNPISNNKVEKLYKFAVITDLKWLINKLEINLPFDNQRIKANIVPPELWSFPSSECSRRK